MSAWENVTGQELAQGDLLPQTLVPIIGANFPAGNSVQTLSVEEYDLIVVTQTCDLVQGKISAVLFARTYSLDEFEGANPAFSQRGQWESVRKGRFEALLLLPSPEEPDMNRRCLVTDFRSVHALPVEYVFSRAASIGPRWRLKSPYVEDFSQRFARFFMRVALPTEIPRFY